MSAMTTREMDRALAGFGYLLEQAMNEPPHYFDPCDLYVLYEAVQGLRITALEREALVQAGAKAELKSALCQWYHEAEHAQDS